MKNLLFKNISLKAILLVLVLSFTSSNADVKCKEVYGEGKRTFKLATGSPGELGLLKVIAEKFSAKNDAVMCWVKAGSGKSLQLLKNKEVDIIMVHAPAAEKKAVEEGWAIKRTLIGSNEFYVVGPKNDPAKIANAKKVDEAFAMISKVQTPFMSRGDNSGTHKKELAIWKKAGIEPKGDWYRITKDFMMATLKKANDVGGYFMTDSSTWVAGMKEMNNLEVLFKGDPMLMNHYHALSQPEGATQSQDLASKFVDFLASEEIQKLIAQYGVAEYGSPMYNNAKDTH